MANWYIENTGGTAIDIEASYSIRVLTASGVGMPPLQNVVTSYGLADGGLFQRTVAPPRVFTLNCVTTTASLSTYHTARDNLIGLLRRDRQATVGPVTIRYVSGGTVEIEAYYDAGLELEQPLGFKEKFPLRFIAPDPFWKELTTNTTALNINSTTVITNTGTAEAYPIFTFVGTGNITQISNDTTGKVLNFSGLSVTTGETVTIDLSPGAKTVSSDVRGNLLANVSSGSNLSTFSLLVGANTISVTADAEFTLTTLAGETITTLAAEDLGLLESAALNLTTKNAAYVNRHWSVDGV